MLCSVLTDLICDIEGVEGNERGPCNYVACGIRGISQLGYAAKHLFFGGSLLDSVHVTRILPQI